MLFFKLVLVRMAVRVKLVRMAVRVKLVLGLVRVLGLVLTGLS